MTRSGYASVRVAFTASPLCHLFFCEILICRVSGVQGALCCSRSSVTARRWTATSEMRARECAIRPTAAGDKVRRGVHRLCSTKQEGSLNDPPVLLESTATAQTRTLPCQHGPPLIDTRAVCTTHRKQGRIQTSLLRWLNRRAGRAWSSGGGQVV